MLLFNPTSLLLFQDSHGLEDENAAPATDVSQDVHLVHGTQNDTHTVVTFTRSWHACDPQDRTLTVSSTLRVFLPRYILNHVHSLVSVFKSSMAFPFK